MATDTLQPPPARESAEEEKLRSPICTVIVVEESLSIGHAANAAAVLAVTLGARVSGLPGADTVDADGGVHPGLIPYGLPVLRAPAAMLRSVHDRALTMEKVTVIDFLAPGHQTNDYEVYRATVAATPATELHYIGVALHGPRKPISRLVGNLGLLR